MRDNRESTLSKGQGRVDTSENGEGGGHLDHSEFSGIQMAKELKENKKLRKTKVKIRNQDIFLKPNNRKKGKN